MAALRRSPTTPLRLCTFALLAAVTGLLASGCATTRAYEDEDSDLPWATPESWEGSPLIPGFENR